MKICAVTDDFHPNVGGMAQHVCEIYEPMARAGHEVRIINLRVGPLGDPIHRLGSIPVVQAAVSTRCFNLEMGAYWLRLRGLIDDEYRRSPFDVLHWHDLRAGPVVRMFRPSKGRVLKVFTNHSSRYLQFRRTWLVKKYFQFSLNCADVLIAPSQELLECSRADFRPGIRYLHIPNGVDETRFYPAAKDPGLLREFDLTPEDRVVFCPRRLAPKNGVYYLVKAMPGILQAFPKAVLLVAGGGYPMKEEMRIRREIERAGLSPRVRLPGNVPNEKMPGLYNLADVVVMPSLIEAISLAALEAMACAKPVVATNVGGLSELFSDPGRGLLVQPRDSGAIEGAVIRVLGDPEKGRALGESGRREVLERYTWEKIADRTLQAFRENLS
jgi:glycosyltransferase involved in cell wall biosynthesis